jgi:hypothetical protein
MSFTVDDSRIVGIESMRNPDKLTHVSLRCSRRRPPADVGGRAAARERAT